MRIFFIELNMVTSNRITDKYKEVLLFIVIRMKFNRFTVLILKTES